MLAGFEKKNLTLHQSMLGLSMNLTFQLYCVGQDGMCKSDTYQGAAVF